MNNNASLNENQLVHLHHGAAWLVFTEFEDSFRVCTSEHPFLKQTTLQLNVNKFLVIGSIFDQYARSNSADNDKQQL